jgi:hypothetical protein
MTLTPEAKMIIAESLYCYDYDLSWEELTDTGKQDYIEGYVDPFPIALDKAGYKIVPKGMICHW